MRRILATPILAVLILFVVPTLAQNKTNEEMGTLDAYFGGRLMIGYGDYEMGAIDNGSLFGGQFGGRAGLKLGPILIGGEYLEGNYSGSSDLAVVSDSDRIGHPSLDSTTAQSWAWNLGYMKNRWLIWYGYQGYHKFKVTALDGASKYNFGYEGDAHMLEISLRLSGQFYLGAYWRTHKFDRYSSTHTDPKTVSAVLDPELTFNEYGITLTVMGTMAQALKQIVK